MKAMYLFFCLKLAGETEVLLVVTINDCSCRCSLPIKSYRMEVITFPSHVAVP